MYNQYNPYMNRFYNQQNTGMGQPLEIPVQQQVNPQIPINRGFLNGKQVDSIDTVKSMDIPLDGSISYFPLANGSAIVTKQLKQDGSSEIKVYEPKTQKENVKFVTVEDVDKRLEGLEFPEIDDLKEDLDDLKKEIREIKSKLKSKKEN